MAEGQARKFTYETGDVRVWVRGERMTLEEFERRKEAGELTDEDLD